jgi:hypothetical protein
MLRTLYISNGGNAKPPVRFLPANANATGLILVDNAMYASTSGNCAGVPNGVWAIDTSAATPEPMHWATNGGGVAGTFGVALGIDGATAYAATSDGEYSPAAFSDSVVALDTKTLTKTKIWSRSRTKMAVFIYWMARHWVERIIKRRWPQFRMLIPARMPARWRPGRMLQKHDGFW